MCFSLLPSYLKGNQHTGIDFDPMGPFPKQTLGAPSKDRSRGGEHEPPEQNCHINIPPPPRPHKLGLEIQAIFDQQIRNLKIIIMC